MNKIVYKIYLYYLGILPAAATFFLMQRLEFPSWIGMPIFFIGTAIVAVHLSMAISYTKPTKKFWWLILVLIDGPILALIGNLNLLEISNIIIDIFLIETLAIWISIGILAGYSGRPAKGQQIASLILVFLSVGGLLGFYYAAGYLIKPWYLYISLLIAIAETLWIKYKILDKDEIEVEATDTTLFIVGNLFLWLIAMVVGGIISNS